MIASAILDVLYPRSCSVCGGAVGKESRYLCWDCLSECILIRPPFCQRCGDPVEGMVGDSFTCHTCHAQTIYFDLARSAARYDRGLRLALQDFKYRDGLWLSSDLVDLLEACLKIHVEVPTLDGVVAVPLHRSKRRQRGYNQSERLARPLASRLGISYNDTLIRIRDTRTQTNLTALQRVTNVKGAFQTRRSKDLKGKHVLLIDDVMTTGATVNECSRALKSAGAMKVTVLTVARG